MSEPEVSGRDTEATITIPKNTNDKDIKKIGRSISKKLKDRECFPRKILCKVDCSLDFGTFY